MIRGAPQSKSAFPLPPVTVKGECCNYYPESVASAPKRYAFAAERNAALERVQLLSGVLPLCAACKKIGDDEGSWHEIESYISEHSQAKFSHGLCPDCGKQYYGELWLQASKETR